MKSYKMNTPHAAFALAAAALTALTIGVAVVLPAHAHVDRANQVALAAADRDAPALPAAPLTAPADAAPANG